MQYNTAMQQLLTQLGTHKIMALAASQNNFVSVRNISCLIIENKIYFKTDKNFRKTKQLLANPHVALCVGGIGIEGIACNHGLVIENTKLPFQQLYEKYWATSYNAYPHTESEILIEVIPSFVEIWNQDAENKGFQLLIDCQKKTVEIRQYD